MTLRSCETGRRARLALFATALVAAAAIAPAAPETALPDRIGDYVRGFLQRHAVPSAAVSVVKDGAVVFAAGYGAANLEWKIPADEKTLYEIGSISKQFTAEAVLMLVEEGTLGLDDPIGRWLPSVPAAWSKITVRHLLTHTSGLYDWDGAPDFSYRREYTPAEYVGILAAHPLAFEPGERPVYTNGGFPLLGLIVEAVSGRPFEAFVAERIFKPARMASTRFKHPEEIVERRAAGYLDNNGTLQNGEPLRPAIIAPNGGIMSSAADLANWSIALGNGALVKPATLDLMTAPLRLNDGTPYDAGMAWFLDTYRGRRLLLHNGSTTAGFSSVVYRYPAERLAVSALMNLDRWNAVNVLATRVAAFFVRGLSNAELAEMPDPDPTAGTRFLALLADIAEGRPADLLAPSLKRASGEPALPRDWGFRGTPDRFAAIDKEDLGAEGVLRFGQRIRWICRYRLTAGSRVVDYTFELKSDGKVARMFPEIE